MQSLYYYDYLSVNEKRFVLDEVFFDIDAENETEDKWFGSHDGENAVGFSIIKSACDNESNCKVAYISRDSFIAFAW